MQNDIMQNDSAARKPWLAALMSLVLPGFGQLYNGEVNKAIWLFLCFAFLTVPAMALVALYLPAGLMMPALLVSLSSTFAVSVYGILDAWRTARRLHGYVPQPWQISGMYMLVLVMCNFVALPMLIKYVRAHQVEPFRIPSSSMEPGVLKGDFLFADKRYNCPGCKAGVARGDVAIFANPNDRSMVYIKRIIGLPGDRVQIRGKDVILNGQSLKAQEVKSAGGSIVTERIGDREWRAEWQADVKTMDIDLVVPPGQVLVLGDNRGVSMDSRHFNTVPLQDVVGKAHQIWFSIGDSGIRWKRMGQLIE